MATAFPTAASVARAPGPPSTGRVCVQLGSVTRNRDAAAILAAQLTPAFVRGLAAFADLAPRRALLDRIVAEGPVRALFAEDVADSACGLERGADRAALAGRDRAVRPGLALEA